MSGLDLDAIRARIPDGYDGPWYVERDSDGNLLVGYPIDNPDAGLVATVPDYGADLAKFIAHARIDIPALLAEVTALRVVADVADAYEVAWNRWANPFTLAPEVEEWVLRLDRAKAHQALLDVVRTQRETS